jgi:TfoX/Sxy family transcriptional regulator of competence genes
MSVQELFKPTIAAMERACPAPPEEIDLTFRPMFGGMGVYAHGRIFASLSDVGLALKLPVEHQGALLDEPGAKRLQYDPSMPPSREYIVVPPAIVEDSPRLEAWMERSIEYVKTLPIKKKTAKKKG